ncbi:MAG: hypothetical protein EBU01_09320, partial [Crocinitomicaceae bacterium]|nr:hypothetical protein [Crocinitomicaceae bacterium]
MASSGSSRDDIISRVKEISQKTYIVDMLEKGEIETLLEEINVLRNADILSEKTRQMFTDVYNDFPGIVNDYVDDFLNFDAEELRRQKNYDELIRRLNKYKKYYEYLTGDNKTRFAETMALVLTLKERSSGGRK